MKNGTKDKLIGVAYQNALLPYHGYVDGKETNLEPMIRLFPRWNVKDADCAWCAAFVYYCLVEAGFEIPYSPDECKTCSLAGCGGLEEFAMENDRIEYHKTNEQFCPEAGDIVIYDNVFMGREHDHTGIIVGREDNFLIVAEGNVPGTNTSGIVRRRIDEHIRCYIRIHDGYCYIISNERQIENG